MHYCMLGNFKHLLVKLTLISRFLFVLFTPHITNIQFCHGSFSFILAYFLLNTNMSELDYEFDTDV